MFMQGVLAGAAGTVALDMASYADMLLRGRPASELPTNVVKKIATRLGFERFAAADDPATKSRQAALGACFGYGVGLGAGIVYALVRPRVAGWLPWPIAGVVLGAATLVASEGSATALGATDWSTWSRTDWIADIVPRAAYGLATAWAVETIDVW